MPDDHSVAESSSTWGVVNVEAAETGNPAEELKSASTKMPWVISECCGALTHMCNMLTFVSV
jgi:1-phosphatidylinositol-3-phosphate 5-kinase